MARRRSRARSRRKGLLVFAIIALIAGALIAAVRAGRATGLLERAAGHYAATSLFRRWLDALAESPFALALFACAIVAVIIAAAQPSKRR